MSRLDDLSIKLAAIWQEHADEIKKLERIGPRGGHNARFVGGWHWSPNGTVTRAAHMSGLATMNYWSGSGTTPASAIPSVCYYKALDAYKEIYGGKK